MANDAAKKRVKANAAALASMRLFLAVANVAYAVSMGVAAARHQPVTRGLLLWAAYLAVEGGLYLFLSSSAAPVRDAQGTLVSGGTDLAAPVCCPPPSFLVCVPRRCGGRAQAQLHLVSFEVVCERGPTCTPYACPNVCVLTTFLCSCVSLALPGTSMLLVAANTLPTQGFIEYTRDALMVATAAHALCAASAWGSLLLVSIPMYAVSMAASASARRSSNAFSAFGGGADGAPTAAAAAAAPPGRAQEGNRRARRASARR